MQTNLTEKEPRTWGVLPLLAWALLALTIVLSLVWSHFRLMWVDEFLEFYTDGLPTFRDVLNVQLHYPLGVEPFTDHFLTHGFMTILGRNAFALRMPALIGFLLFQTCLYFFVNRIAGYRSAIIAMTFPLITNTVARSVDGRPYGLLMGLFALALVCWQSAAHSEGSHRSRLPALIILWLAISFCISTHYFGILILIPLLLAEVARAISKKHIDRAMAITISLGFASVALVLPFINGAKEFRYHFYRDDPLTVRFVVELYRRVILGDPYPLSHRGQMAFIGILALTLTIGVIAHLRQIPQSDFHHRDPSFEWVALLALAMIPLFGCVLDVLATHALAPRYVLPAAFSLAACVGIVLLPVVRRAETFYSMMVILVGAGLWVNLWNINRDRLQGLKILASCAPSAAVNNALDKNPTQRIYVQNFSEYMVYSFYAPNPAIRSRLTLLTDKQQLQWEHLDNVYLMTENLRHFGPMTIVPYDDFLKLEHPLILFYTRATDGDVWIDRDIKARGRDLKIFGPWMDGYLAEVLPNHESASQTIQP